MLENIRNELDSGECAIGIFLDFQTVLVAVDHGILLDKLYNYGIRGISLDWFSSYLSNRFQIVSCNSRESEPTKITCGVPRGSILSPLWFLLYVNDFPKVSDVFMRILFADAANFFALE